MRNVSWVASAVVMVGVLIGSVAQAAVPEVSDRPNELTVIKRAVDVVAWAKDTDYVRLFDLSASAAYAQRDAKDRVRLEAMAICLPGFSSGSSAAKVTYKFVSRFTGPALIKPVGQIWGDITTWPPSLGSGGAEAKITFDVWDDTYDDAALEQVTVHKAESVDAMEVATKGESIHEKAERIGLGGYNNFWLQAGHEYTAKVKLWIDCWATAGYTVRADYSRHDPDLIGMVLVDAIHVLPIGESREETDPISGGRQHQYVE